MQNIHGQSHLSSIDAPLQQASHQKSFENKMNYTFLHRQSLQGERLLAKVFSVTKFGKIFKKTSTTTSSINCGDFNGCSI
jgi:hypothetical protein